MTADTFGLADDVEASRNVLTVILSREGDSLCPSADGLTALARVMSETSVAHAAAHSNHAAHG